MLKMAFAIVAGLCACGSLTGCATGTHSPRARDFNDSVTEYLTTVRIDLVDGKTDLINDVMRLTDAEAEIFWEIYARYEDEYFALGDRRAALERELAERTSAGTLDDASAARLGAEFLNVRGEMLDLLRRTHARLSAELSPKHAGQFLQIEHRTETVVDLIVASQMPLVRRR
jgi:hypothetical protein